VRNGEIILSTVSIPRTDHFSYTRDGQPWFAWEWLSDVTFGLLHRAAGLAGVALIAAILIAIAIAGAAHLALSLGGNLFFTAVASVLILGTTSIHWLARPHLFSWALALLFVGVAEHERKQAGRALVVLPFAAALCANIHGSFLLGPAILFIYPAGAWLERKDAYRFATASLACLLTTFINPYGWRLHEHILSYLQNSYLMDHIQEFRSFDFHSSGALYVELFLAVAFLGTVVLLKQRAFGPALLSVAMLHASLYAARYLPMAAVILLPLCVAALTHEAKGRAVLRGFFEYSDRLRSIDRQIAGVVPVVLVLGATVFGLAMLSNSGSIGFDASTFPVRAADYLEKQNIGRIFAKDQWGGYLIYRFAGRGRVFIDGRSDFYGQRVLETYAQVTEVKPGWDAVLREYDVRVVLVPPDNALASALKLSQGWRRVYSDRVSTVFERVS